MKIRKINSISSEKGEEYKESVRDLIRYITGITFFVFFTLFWVPGTLQAQSIEKRIGILEKEIESLRLVRATKKYESVGGLGPAASEVYHAGSGLSIGGYGEAKYINYKSNHQRDQFDLHRFILYTGYRFNDWIVLNTEIEIEHADEVFAEFAYLDFQFDPALSVAAGLQLIPSGITNFLHEPTTFDSVNRPQTERNIIPSTWREHGLSLYGSLAQDFFSYRLGVFSGGDALGFKEESWIRSGRQKGSQAKANDFAGIASFDIRPLLAWKVGFSYYMGDNGQGQILAYSDDDGNIQAPPSGSDLEKQHENRLLGAKVRTHLAEAHSTFESGPFKLRALFARGWMNEDDTRAVNRATGKNIGKVVEGAYLEIAYNILDWFGSTKQKLYFFVRNEYLNTQKETITCRVANDCVDASYSVPNFHDPGSPFTGNRGKGVIENSKHDTAEVKGIANPANDRRILTYGLAYFPDPNVVLKLDFEDWNSKSKEDDSINPKNNQIDRMNLSIGWIF